MIMILILGCSLAGCGYQFRAEGTPLGIELQSLAIPLIKSTSTDLAFEADFTRVIRDEFIGSTKLPLVSVERAQAVLSGTVYDIITEPISFRQTQVTADGQTSTFSVTNRRRLIIKLDVKLTERTSGRVIWHESAMEEKSGFDVSTDPLVTQFNQQQAVEAIARLMAKRIYLKTVERF